MVASPMAAPLVVDDGGDGVSASAVTWSAIIAGGVTAAAVSFILLILGAGLGLTAVSPWSSDAGTATALGVGALIWLIVTQWIASGLGGYLTGRLRTKWVSVHTDEVFFRDTAHGFLAWAVATLLSAALLASAASAVVSGAASTAATIVTGAAQGAAEGAAQSAGPTSSGSAYFVDMLFRSDRPAAGVGERDTRGESERILLKSLADGEMSAEDKTYLAQMVAAQTGLTPQEAEQRVDQVIAQANEAAAAAKQIADDARKAGATLAIVSFLSLLIGAFIAGVGAALGGRQRDEHEIRYATR